MARRVAAAAAVMLAVAMSAGPFAQADPARLLERADTLLRASDLAQARAAAAEAMTIAESLKGDRLIGDAALLLARIERSAGNAAAAAVHAQRALAAYESLDDQRGIAIVSLQLAALHDADVAAMSGWYERAAGAAHAAGDANREGAALHRHGDGLFNAAQYERSLELLTRAAAVYEGAGAYDDLGTVYNSIGRVYRAHGRLDEALNYQKAALALHRKTGDQFTLLQSLNAVGVVYQSLNDLAAARAYLREAIGVAATLPPTPRSVMAQNFLRANMADVLRDSGEHAAAAAALEEVIAAGSDRDAFRAIRFSELARAYAAMGRGADAVAAAARATALCGESKIDCIAAYGARSDAEAVLGDRDAALRDLSKMLEGIEDLRTQLVPSDFFKQDFSTYYRDAYGSAIALQFDAGRTRESLETAELARSRAFLDLLASRSIGPSAGTPALPLTLRGAGAPTSVFSPATTPPARSADLVRTAARLRSTLLLYWVSDQETYIWVVRADGRVNGRRVKVARARLLALVAETSPFAAATGTLQAAASQAVLKDSTAAARALYTLLIAPVRSLLPDGRGALLTVVPHGALAGLSFAALQTPAGRYLLEDYTLHYAPAGALFEFTSPARPRQPPAGTMLMVSDPEPARRSTLDPPLPRLPGARLEADAITRQLPANQVRALSGAAATELAVREHAPHRSILHFAAHTVVRDDDPFTSYLALGRSSADDEGDGVLTAQDIYRLRLPADLVVLSACRSASGTIAGDGVASFARAFVYAGASSIIASMWDLADEPSNRLLPVFYRAWLGGATKAAALRQAQLRLLGDLRAGRVQVTTPVGAVAVPEHPVFWAGFVLFGEPD